MHVATKPGVSSLNFGIPLSTNLALTESKRHCPPPLLQPTHAAAAVRGRHVHVRRERVRRVRVRVRVRGALV